MQIEECGELRNLGDYVLNARKFDVFAFGNDVLAGAVVERMAAIDCSTIDQYIDSLEVRPAEFQLFFDLLFQGRMELSPKLPQWEYLRQTVVGQLSAEGKPFRAWCIGCKTGEQAYVIAMMLCDQLGFANFGKLVKIFVTNKEEDVLSAARRTHADKAILDRFPAHWAETYFTHQGDNYILLNEIRRALIFGKHDILVDPHISKMDLIVSRYILPYYDREGQRRIICDRFELALKDKGQLLIGEGENLARDQSFVPVGPAAFVKNVSEASMQAAPARPLSADVVTTVEPDRLLSERAFDSSPTAHIVIDDKWQLCLVNDKARRLFGLSSSDVGRPIQDLEISYRPVELRSLMEAAVSGVPTAVPTVTRLSPSGEMEYFEILVKRVADPLVDLYGFSVQYQDVTKAHLMRLDLTALSQQLQTANEELQSAHEELETANEELQSMNEELETTNEELRSTNEELETINEELQTTNSELEMTNAQQRSLASSVESTNHFLEDILGGMRSAIIVLNANFQVLVWNKRATDLWGLRLEDVRDQSFFSLDIGLPVDKLIGPIRQFQNSNDKMHELLIDGLNRTGKPLVCQIRLTHMRDCPGDDLALIINDRSQNPLAGGSGHD